MKEKIKVIQIIHLALCTGLILAYFFLGNFMNMETFSLPEINNENIIFTLVPIIAIVVGNLLFKQQLKTADKRKTPEDNFSIYQTASIMRYAVLEGAAFLILFIQPALLVFGMLIIVYLIYFRPTEEKVIKALKS